MRVPVTRKTRYAPYVTEVIVLCAHSADDPAVRWVFRGAGKRDHEQHDDLDDDDGGWLAVNVWHTEIVNCVSAAACKPCYSIV